MRNHNNQNQRVIIWGGHKEQFQTDKIIKSQIKDLGDDFEDQQLGKNPYQIKRNLSNLPLKNELTDLLSLPQLFDQKKLTEYGTDSKQIFEQMNFEDQQNFQKINTSFNKTFSQFPQNKQKTPFKNFIQKKASSKQPNSYNFIYPKAQISSQSILDKYNSSRIIQPIRSIGYSTIASNNLLATNNISKLQTSSHDQTFMKSKESEIGVDQSTHRSNKQAANINNVLGQYDNSYYLNSQQSDQLNNENSMFTRQNNISTDSNNQQIQQESKQEIQDEEVDNFIDKLASVRNRSLNNSQYPKNILNSEQSFYQNREQLNHQIISKTKLIKTVQRRELYNYQKNLNLPNDQGLQKRVLNFDSPPKKNFFTNPQSFLTTVQIDTQSKPQSVQQTIEDLNNSEIIKNNKTRQNFLIQKLVEQRKKKNVSKQETLPPHDLSEGAKPHVRFYQKELQKRSEQLKEAFDFQISQFENLQNDESNQLFEVKPLHEHLQTIKTLDEIEIKFKEQIQGACSQCQGLKGSNVTNFYKSDHQLFDYLLHFCLKHREENKNLKDLYEVKISRDKMNQKMQDSKSYEKLKQEIQGQLTQLIQTKIIEDEIARRPNYFMKFEEAKKNFLTPFVSTLDQLAFREASVKESMFRHEKKQINFKNTARKLIWLISKQGDILSKDEFLKFLLLVPGEKEEQSIFFNQVQDLSYMQIKETLIEYLNRNSKEPQLIEDYYKDLVDQLPTSSVLTYEFDPDLKVEFQEHIKQVVLSQKQEAFMTLISSIRNKQYFLQSQLKQIFSTRNEQLFEIENGKQIYNGEQGILFAQACKQNKAFANPLLVTNPDQSRIDLDNFVVIDQPIDAAGQELRIQGIPQELFFANTKLSDEAFATILNSLSTEQASQLKSIVLSGQNEFGEQTLNIIKSRVVRLKELRLVGTKIKQMESLNSLLSSFIPDLRLQVLSLSRLDMSTRVIDNLISVLACRSGLKVLDISWNHISENQISKILLNLTGHYNLRQLNLAFIPIFGDMKPTEQKKDIIKEKVKLSSFFYLKQFIRNSTALQHLNLSGVLQSEFQIIKIIKSINNSKSLLAVHLDQTPLLQTSQKLIDYIEKKLKLKCKVQNHSVQMKLQTVSSQSVQQYLNRYELTLQTKQSTREQLYFDYQQSKMNHEFILQRTIAHSEMENNKQWKIRDDCYFCNKWQYSVIWQVLENKKIDIVQEQAGSDDEKTPRQMYQMSQPPKINQTNIDFLIEDNNKFKDIRQIAFGFIKSTQTMTENELLESFLHFVSNQQLEKLKDYPEIVKNILKKLKNNDLSLLDQPSNIQDTPVFWAILLEKLKTKFIQFIPPLENYQSFTKLCREISESQGARTLFIQALYIKPSKTIKFLEFHDHPKQQLFCVPLPRIDDIALCLTEPKDKGEDGPRFIKEQSVFRHWQEDTPALLQQAMKTDFQYWKLGKMVKDQTEFKECKRVIERYFVKLKEIYITLISSDSFPYIGWNDFGLFCRQAEIVDEQYSNNFIDVIISGVKSGTGAKTLCRHEFVEVLVRIASSKYRESGKASSFSKALEMLVSSIIQNYKFVKPWQQFRDELLWSREVDILFKTNYTNVLKVFDALFPKLKTTATGITQCVDLIIRHTNLNMQDRDVRACYGMSKSTVIDEINNNSEYDKLRLPEFLEFLGRIAHTKFSTEKSDEPFKMETALEHVLREVLDVYGFRLKIPEPDLLDAQSSEESLQDYKY